MESAHVCVQKISPRNGNFRRERERGRKKWREREDNREIGGREKEERESGRRRGEKSRERERSKAREKQKDHGRERLWERKKERGEGKEKRKKEKKRDMRRGCHERGRSNFSLLREEEKRECGET